MSLESTDLEVESDLKHWPCRGQGHHDLCQATANGVIGGKVTDEMVESDMKHSPCVKATKTYAGRPRVSSAAGLPTTRSRAT